MTTATIQHSPLHDIHVNAGAKLIDFHGWMLPVQYSSILEEHHAVRKAAGLFDISHMGQLVVEGPKAFEFLQNLMTNDLTRLKEKSLAVYGHLCNEQGQVLDDIYVYGTAKTDAYFVMVNSATVHKDVAWLRKHATKGVNIIELTNRAGIALQGPAALGIIRKVMAGVSDLPRFAYQQMPAITWQETLWACRTGYTGEEGAEFFGPIQTISLLWKQFMEAGKEFGIKPCGLGARDTLRLEVGYPLYGHELDEAHTSLESNLPWAVKLSKPNFIGKAALEKQKQTGTSVLMMGFELTERGIPRAGYSIFSDGKEIAKVASGTFSPTLQKGIGTAFFPIALAKPGQPIEVEINQKRVKAVVCGLTFYKK